LCVTIAIVVAGVAVFVASSSGTPHGIALADESSPEFTITLPTASTNFPGYCEEHPWDPICTGGGGGDPGGGGQTSSTPTPTDTDVGGGDPLPSPTGTDLPCKVAQYSISVYPHNMKHASGIPQPHLTIKPRIKWCWRINPAYFEVRDTQALEVTRYFDDASRLHWDFPEGNGTPPTLEPDGYYNADKARIKAKIHITLDNPISPEQGECTVSINRTFGIGGIEAGNADDTTDCVRY
jgi:hypothetical protein